MEQITCEIKDLRDAMRTALDTLHCEGAEVLLPLRHSDRRLDARLDYVSVRAGVRGRG